MAKVLKLVLAVAVAMCSHAARAQFSISTGGSEKSVAPVAWDSVYVGKEYRGDYFSEAKWRAERKAIRKERNTVDFDANLSLTQTQFENWESGGENTFTGRTTLHFRHAYTRNKFGFATRVDARYGVNHIDKKSFKNEDEFKINLMTTWNIRKKWYYSAAANLRSQFSVGRSSRTDDTRISTFMAPGYLDLAVGFTYSKSPWTIVLSPVGGSAIFVLDDELSARGVFGVPAGERARWQVGPSVRVNVDSKFAKDKLHLRSELHVFSNIKKPPIVRWETTFTVFAAKYLSTTFYTLVFYNSEADTPLPDHIQFKYSIGFGLQYSFRNK